MKAVREALLRGRRRPRRSGAGSPTLYRGDGYEFVELRAYVPGDDVRRIDWAASARSTELQTRVVLEDVALTLACVIDESGSMRVGRERTLLESAREAQSAWYACADRSDRLVHVERDAQWSFARTLAAAAQVLPRGSALLAVSDLWEFDEAKNAIEELGLRCDCTALLARDPWFDGLPLRGFVRVRDAETGRTQQLFLGKKQRARFADALAKRQTEIIDRLQDANWRTGFLREADGAASLLSAFGVR